MLLIKGYQGRNAKGTGQSRTPSCSASGPRYVDLIKTLTRPASWRHHRRMLGVRRLGVGVAIGGTVAGLGLPGLVSAATQASASTTIDIRGSWSEVTASSTTCSRRCLSVGWSAA